MTEYKMSLIYDCPKCKARNFLDPYSYWEYKGNFKCGGCDELYYAEWENGQRVVDPGKPKNCVVSARGKLVACTQLKPEDLEGSCWKRITAQRKFGKSW